MEEGPDFDFSQTQAFNDFDINGLEDENVANGLKASSVYVANRVQNVDCDRPTPGNSCHFDAHNLDTGPGFEFSQTQAPVDGLNDSNVPFPERSTGHIQMDEEEPTQQVISPSIPVHWSGVEAEARAALRDANNSNGNSNNNDALFPYSSSGALPTGTGVSHNDSASTITMSAPDAGHHGIIHEVSEPQAPLSMAKTIAMVENLTQTSADIVTGLMGLNPEPGTYNNNAASGNSYRTPFELLNSRASTLATGSRQSTTGGMDLNSSVNGPISEPVLVSVGKYHRRKFKFDAESDGESDYPQEREVEKAGVYDFDEDDCGVDASVGQDDDDAEWSSQAFTKPGGDSVLSVAEKEARDREMREVDRFGIPGKLYADVVSDSLLIYGNNNMQFRDVWEYLERYGGWTWRKGKGLVSFRYYQPGKTDSDTPDVDFFDSEDDLLSFVYARLMERVGAAEKAEREAKAQLLGKDKGSGKDKGKRKDTMAATKAAPGANLSKTSSSSAQPKARRPQSFTAAKRVSVPASPSSLGSLSSSDESEADSESEVEEEYTSDSDRCSEVVDAFGIPLVLYRDLAADVDLRLSLKFKIAWNYLEEVGWAWRKGRGLISFFYCKPGKTEKDSLNVDYFQHEDDVLAFLMSKVAANKRVAAAEVQHQKRCAQAARRVERENRRVARRAAKQKAREEAAARRKARDEVEVKRRAKEEEAEARRLAREEEVEAKRLAREEEADARKLAREEEAEAKRLAREEAKAAAALKLSKANLEKHERKLARAQGRLSGDGREDYETAASNGRSRASSRDDFDGDDYESSEEEDDVPWQQRVMSMPWSDLWKQLMTEGWTWDYGSGLVYQWFIAPGVNSKAERVRDVNTFDSEMAVRSHVDNVFQKSARKSSSRSSKVTSASSSRRRSGRSHEHAIDVDADDSESELELGHWKEEVMTMPWKVVWKQLMSEGWTWDYGSGLVYQWFIAPGVNSKAERVRDVNTFDSEMAVRSHVDNVFQKSARKTFTRSSKSTKRNSSGRRRGSRGSEHLSDAESVRSSSVKAESGAEEEKEEEDEEEEVEGEEEISDSESGLASEADVINWKEEVMTMPWKELWKQLMSEGWTWDYGSGLVAQWYIAPGITSKSQRRRGENTFDSEDEVRRVARRMFENEGVDTSPTQPFVSESGGSAVAAEEEDANPSGFAEEWILARHRDKRGSGSSSDVTPMKRVSPGNPALSTSSNKKQKLRIAASPNDDIECINNASRINQSNPRTPKKPRLSDASAQSSSGAIRAPIRRVEAHGDANPTTIIQYYHANFRLFGPVAPGDSPLVVDKPFGLFANYAFLLSSLPESMRSSLAEEIMRHGGMIVLDFPAEVTSGLGVDTQVKCSRCYTTSLVPVQGKFYSSYAAQFVRTASVLVALNNIVVVALPSGFRRPNYLFAIAAGSLIVHPQWIDECVKQREIASYDRFVLPTGTSVVGPYFSFPVSCATRCPGAPVFPAYSHFLKGCPIVPTNSLFRDLRVMVLSCPSPAQTGRSRTGARTYTVANMWTKLLVLAGCVNIFEDIAELLRILNRRLGLREDDDEAEDTRSFSNDLVRFPILPDVIVVDPLTVQQALAFKAYGAGADVPEIAVIASVLDRLQRLHEGGDGQGAAFPRGLSMWYPVHTQLVTIDWVSYCIAAGELVSPSLSPLFTLPGFVPVGMANAVPVVKNRRPVTVFRGETERYVINDIVYYANAAPSSSSTEKDVTSSPHKFVNRGVSLGRIVEMYETINGACLPAAGVTPSGSLIIKIIPVEARMSSSGSPDMLPSVLTPKFLLRTKDECSQYCSSDCVMITPSRLCGKPVVCSTHSVKHLSYLASGQDAETRFPTPFIASSLWERQSMNAHVTEFHGKYMRSSRDDSGEVDALESDSHEIQPFSDFPMSQDA